MHIRPILAAATTAVTVLGALVVASPASAAPVAIDPAGLTLDQDFHAYDEPLAKLDATLGARRRTVSAVMAAANRDRAALCNKTAWQPLADRSGTDTIGFCWQDATTRRPNGIRRRSPPAGRPPRTATTTVTNWWSQAGTTRAPG
ncbi:hypothetical protein [Plantactinospora sp. GCM10030261]|uniref:hypothetical protein n=1 Tax=Plantactinospora sp. GCM10030261 TaxID=3273420 RepID=UPI003609C443